jgi:ATP-dependent DNA helicase RecG
MITLATVESWLVLPSENERIEFKEAKLQFDTTKLLKYCAAIANELGGHLILGVTNKLPRQVVGTQAFPSEASINNIKSRILDKLKFRVEVSELLHPNGRVLVFEIPSRPIALPIAFDGLYLMRVGESLVAMSPDVLKRIFAEDNQEWFTEPAKANVSAEDIIALLDTQTCFELLEIPYPTNRNAVLERLEGFDLIRKTGDTWSINNMAAIVLAKRLDSFSPVLARKAPRFIQYDGVDKLKTRVENIGHKGYAVGFKGLVEFVHSAAPQNRFIEEVVREEVKMFPIQALRELIANALIHQDFQETGCSVMIEMFDDRIEISNPGIPAIGVNRFIDENKSPNERLANLMRRFNICEEKGSGIDKVIHEAEIYQLPAPDFRVADTRTTALLFAYKDFSDMSKTDRIRACYQHCCLLYVSNRQMSNKTLRERFSMNEDKAAVISQIISATKSANLIKQDSSDSNSTRYARYIPFWT